MNKRPSIYSFLNPTRCSPAHKCGTNLDNFFARHLRTINLRSITHFTKMIKNWCEWFFFLKINELKSIPCLRTFLSIDFFCRNVLSKFHRFIAQKCNFSIRGLPLLVVSNPSNNQCIQRLEKLYILCIIYWHRALAIEMGENGDKLNRLMPFFMTAFSRLTYINWESTFDR